MMTDVLANKLTEGGGLGLAKVFEQQLSPRTSKATAALAAKDNK
jgi:Rod binding domain-containing protein